MAGDTLTRDVALNVIGKIEGYQKELEKVPGVTQKAATKAALAMQKTFTNDLVKQFKNAEKAAERSAGRWREIFGGIAEHLGADALRGLVKEVAGAKSEIASLTGEISTYSHATGLSAESVNALRFAMESQGRTFSELGSALENFPERMEQFRQGGGEAAAVMEVLGFRTKDADKLIADMGGTFEEVIRRMQGIENEGHRAALMTSMFGDSALYLSTALADVPLEEWKDRAQIGLDVSERTIAANRDWAATMAVLGEAFTRAKQDATNLVDMAGFAKFAGEAFVVMSSVAIDGVGGIMKQASRFVTWMREVWAGDFESAQMVEDEFWAASERGWSGVIDDALEAGRQFRSVANSIGNTAAESEGLNLKLGKTTAEMKAAAQAAKELNAELKKQRDAEKEVFKAFRDVSDDQLTEEGKLLQAFRDRNAEFLFGMKEAQITKGERDRFMKLSEERLGRDIANLHKEQAKEASDFQRDMLEQTQENMDAAKEMARDHFADLVNLGAEFANIATDTAGGIFDLMADKRAEDLEHAKKDRDKHKELIDDLYQRRSEAETKAQMERIDNRIANAKAEQQSLNDGVKAAKKAAREVAAMQKGQALFQIGLDTAQAVMLAWATVPPPLNLAAAVAAGAAGAAQLAIAAAKPLPKFFMGTGRIPGGIRPENMGEAQLNARATANLGPDIIDAMNAGFAPLELLARRFGPQPAAAGGGDVYLDGKKVGRLLAKGSRKPAGYHSPYGRR